MDRYAQVGLAFATSIGAWVNLALLLWFAARQNLITIDDRLRQIDRQACDCRRRARGRVVLRATARSPACSPAGRLHEETTLAALALIGAVVYGGLVLALFGRQWLAAFRRSKQGDSTVDRKS